MPIASSWPLSDGARRLLLPRARREELARSPLTRDCYPTALGYYPQAAGHAMARRAEEHADCLFIHVAAGAGRVWMQGMPDGQDLVAGDLLVLPTGVEHAYEADGMQPWSIHWLHMDGPAVPDLLQLLGVSGAGGVLRIGQSLTMASDFARLLEVQAQAHLPEAWLGAAVSARAWLMGAALLARTERQRAEARLPLADIVMRMQTQAGTSLDVAGMARHYGFSTFHFIRRYKELTGLSPLQHFLHLRMGRACRLLDSTDRTIQSLAEELGYDDAHYFSRVFRKMTGMSPREYREGKRG